MRTFALVLPLLLACTATRLATLQGDFDDLYAAKRNCAGGHDESILRLPCEGQDVALYELALDAEVAANRARDLRTRIALLRLAGVAAWQGAGEEANALVTKLSLEGVKRCDALEERVRSRETWGAPRDCAVLVLLPALLAHEVALEKFAALSAVKQCSLGDIELGDIVDTYADSTVLFVHSQQGKALGYQGVSDSVRKYVAETKRLMMCNFHKLGSFEPALCSDERERARRVKDRIEAELRTTFLDECG